MTPPASPGLKVPISPPRLSLRFSSIQLESNRDSGSNYFNLPGEASLFARESIPAFQYTPAQTPDASKETLAVDEEGTPDASKESWTVDEERTTDASEEDLAVDEEIPTPVLESNPEPVLEEPESTEEPESREEDMPPDSPDPADGPLYILQPRTYTPLPPAPLPSPRVIEGPSREAVFGAREVEEDPRLSRPPIQAKSERRNLAHAVPDEPRPPRRESSRLLEEPQARQYSPRVSQGPQEAEVERPLSTQRTSLRQRVSLRATPPIAIQVPPPELQKPVFASPKTYQNYQTFVGPDSAYGSDAERPPLPSAGQTSVAGFSPPVFPGMVPSPHSDQQCFRPVLASPHSPLQQRPHTAGHVRPSHSRNAPSAMGMSVLSGTSTLNPDNASARKLKKKRSAFGWLKKAFTLDEEERQNFESFRKEQGRNLYYDERSPQFLDGRRLR